MQELAKVLLVERFSGEGGLDTSNFLTTDRVKEVLRTSRIGHQIYAFKTIGSTNELANTLALQGEADGSVIIAEAQTKGRGRAGKRWESPMGKGLWFSVILRPDIGVKRAGLFPLVAAVAVAEAVEGTVCLQPSVKWPNDLLLEEKKFCGILSEVQFTGVRVEYIVLGIGVNVNQEREDFSEELRDKATSLLIVTGRTIDRLALLAEVLYCLEKNYELILYRRAQEVLEKWRELCGYWGQPVVLVQGKSEVSGILEGLSEDGGILLRTSSGTLTKALAGELELK